MPLLNTDGLAIDETAENRDPERRCVNHCALDQKGHHWQSESDGGVPCESKNAANKQCAPLLLLNVAALSEDLRQC